METDISAGTKLMHSTFSPTLIVWCFIFICFKSYPVLKYFKQITRKKIMSVVISLNLSEEQYYEMNAVKFSLRIFSKKSLKELELIAK